jgi:PPOX class probable F420-dependent enzyme
MESGTWEGSFIKRQRVARLATVDEWGRPHLVPIVFAFDGQRLFTPIDAKPKRVSPQRLQRVRNILVNPQVTVLFDEYSEDWRKLAWVQLRGRAEFVESGPERNAGAELLAGRYPQYTVETLAGKPVIIVKVESLTGWRAEG